MEDKEKILFIINPVSGSRKKEEFFTLLDKIPDKDRFAVELRRTEYAGHASVIANEAVQAGIHKIVAVGGDGTVNEVAKELVGSRASLGIIPFGSGNGLARHLKIPMNTSQALQLLNKATERKIDVGYMNAQPFFCTAGLAFDAHVGKVFAGMKGRGLLGYIKSVFREFFQYTTEEYEVEIKGRKSRHRAFLITVANASQYGNNVYIAPHADISDGFLDLCIVKSFSVFQLFTMGYRIFTRSVNKSRYTTTLQVKNLVIRRKNKGAYHIDGEPYEGGKEFKFEIRENSLSVLA